jgi:predicted 2-oxoglutarate/Fe(II)-dependent dioxygenase YbiX
MDHNIKISYVKDTFDVAVIDNFYNKEQLEIVLDECISVLPRMSTPENTASATGAEGEYLKSNHGAFIEENNPPNFVRFDYNIIQSDSLKNQLMNFNSLYRIFRTVNTSSTLLSYYKDGDYYDMHTDVALFTVIVWVFKEPKAFSGGNIVLESVVDGKELTVECLNNRALIFPSCTPHKVTKVSMPDLENSGRFCITHFLNYNDKRPV